MVTFQRKVEFVINVQREYRCVFYEQAPHENNIVDLKFFKY